MWRVTDVLGKVEHKIGVEWSELSIFVFWRHKVMGYRVVVDWKGLVGVVVVMFDVAMVSSEE